jgi:hypothetical protein
MLWQRSVWCFLISWLKIPVSGRGFFLENSSCCNYTVLQYGAVGAWHLVFFN